jgi:thymidylate kinase
MPIVIVEGPDLSGKTTAIETLAKFNNSGSTIKNNYKPKTAEESDKLYEHYHVILHAAKILSNNGKLVILDRYFPSQAVYSFLRGKEELFGDKRIAKLTDLCLFHKIKIIFLDTPLLTLLQRYDDRGDEHIKKEQLIAIKNRYEQFMNETRLPVLYLDTLKDNWLETANKFIWR